MTEQERERLISLEKDVSVLNSAFGKVDGLFNGIHENSTNIAVLTQLVKQLVDKFPNVDERLTNHGQRIGALENKPGKNWEKLTGYIIAALVTLAFGAIQFLGK